MFSLGVGLMCNVYTILWAVQFTIKVVLLVEWIFFYKRAKWCYKENQKNLTEYFCHTTTLISVNLAG